MPTAEYPKLGSLGCWFLSVHASCLLLHVVYHGIEYGDARLLKPCVCLNRLTVTKPGLISKPISLRPITIDCLALSVGSMTFKLSPVPRTVDWRKFAGSSPATMRRNGPPPGAPSAWLHILPCWVPRARAWCPSSSLRRGLSPPRHRQALRTLRL